MSSKIYFTDKSNRTATWWITRAISLLILLLPKPLSVKITKRLLLKPFKRQNTSLPEGMTQYFMPTQQGNIAVYQMGQGPTVLLSHGWSGSASQFFKLMEKLSHSGFQAVAFDQLGHGRSDGKYGNLFLFIETQRVMIEQIEKTKHLKAIIAHSMGTAAALNASRGPHPVLLIAPVFEFSKAMFEKVEQSGVAIQLLKNLLASLELEHKMVFKECDPVNKIADYRGDINIVHDKNDLFAPVQISKEVANCHPQVKLVETSNLGHSRVISSDETWSLFLSLMALRQSNASLTSKTGSAQRLAS